MGHPRLLARTALLMLLIVTTLVAETSWAKTDKDKAAARGQPADDEDALVHRVSKGQTLSGIAHRYHVSVSAIERTNALRPGRPIFPGQRLRIPEATKPPMATPSKAEKTDQAKTDQVKTDQAKQSPGANKQAKSTQASQRQATAEKNPAASQPKKDVQKQAKAAGPPPKAQSKAVTKAQLLSATAPRKAPTDSWRAYRKPAAKPGYVVLRGTAGAYSGFAILKGDRLSPRAYAEVRRVLASWRTGKQVNISERLVRLLVKTSDTFGGRPLRIVGGYREHSYAKASKHCLGDAVDFSVEGVPNDALRDFLRTQPGVGVGFYPNSSFVHLDVRKQSAYWIDHAGPGQPPSYLPRPAPVAPPPVNAPAPLNAEADPKQQTEPNGVAVLSI